jgi:hypothetical protein
MPVKRKKNHSKFPSEKIFNLISDLEIYVSSLAFWSQEALNMSQFTSDLEFFAMQAFIPRKVSGPLWKRKKKWFYTFLCLAFIAEQGIDGIWMQRCIRGEKV